MRAQRSQTAAPALDARAEALPFDDDAFDAAMACVTVHHWEPPEAGLVTRLSHALASGAWDAEHGHLRDWDSFDGALRLVISESL